MSTGESILSPGLVKIYGRPIAEIQLNVAGGAGVAANVHNLGANQFLRAQLNAAGAQLARIYGFSFEGHYYDLPKPVIMLVHGPGEQITTPPPVVVPPVGPGAPGPTVDQAGEAARGWEFSADLVYWEYEKSDFSMRLDVEGGTLEQILLEARLFEDDTQTYYSASNTRIRGSNARVAGSNTQISGSNTRLGGRRGGSWGD